MCFWILCIKRYISAMNGDGREKRVLNQAPCDQGP